MGDAGVGVLIPDWPAPSRVHAAFTLRTGGVSQGRWDSLNLGAHVNDEPAAMAENRRRVRGQLGLPAEPYWLSQVHGVDVVCPEEAARVSPAQGGGRPPVAVVADAAVTRQPGRVLAIQVADCLPVLFAARDGSAVAGAHAGWRGLAAGVLEATVAALSARGVKPRDLLAWIGPGIGPERFEVGAEVREAFVHGLPGRTAGPGAGTGRGAPGSGPGAAGDPGAAAAFAPGRPDHWLCDLRLLAARRLAAAGVGSVAGADKGLEWCTHTHAERFFSHRRDGQCGRMAALVWLE